ESPERPESLHPAGRVAAGGPPRQSDRRGSRRRERCRKGQGAGPCCPRGSSGKFPRSPRTPAAGAGDESRGTPARKSVRDFGRRSNTDEAPGWTRAGSSDWSRSEAPFLRRAFSRRRGGKKSRRRRREARGSDRRPREEKIKRRRKAFSV